MKNFMLIAAGSLIMLSACNQDKEKLEMSNKQNDSLMQVVSERNAELNEFISSFNDVESNLHAVAVKQQLISTDADKTQGEVKAEQKERMNAEIEAINKLMDENRDKIAELSRQMKNSKHKNKELQKLIETLNDQLAQKSVELAALNEKLVALNAQVAQLQTSVDTLTIQNSMQAENISEKTIALHTAYYIVGKTKELQEAKVINKEGGLLGMGKTAKLSENFDSDKFTRIDYTKTTSIEINAEAKIITTHPADSYTMEKADPNKAVISSLKITNPEKFWSASKYLVITTK